MNYDTSPGSLDGPPAKTGPNLLAKIIGGTCVAIPIALVLVAMVWAIAWLITHFPA